MMDKVTRGQGDKGNPKHEFRNSKQVQMTEKGNDGKRDLRFEI